MRKLTLAALAVAAMAAGGCSYQNDVSDEANDSLTEPSATVAQDDAHAITYAQYDGVQVGDSLDSVVDQLGRPDDWSKDESSDFEGGTTKMDMLTYNRVGEDFKGFMFQFQDGKLVSKSSI